MKVNKSQKRLSSFFENELKAMNLVSKNIETLNFIKTELAELERLAEIGRATEKAYSNGGFIIFDVLGEYGEAQSYNSNDSIDDLLDWAKEN